MQAKAIKKFVRDLSKYSSTRSYFNQFAQGSPANAVRRHNLSLYLTDLAKNKPTVLLVGEAPGYQGSRLSGVPFMSNHLMMRGVPELKMFGPEHGYKLAGDGSPDQKEPSATIVWRTFAENQFLPMLWAAFPFHPHKIGLPRTNRRPNSDEVKLGQTIIFQLRDIFGIKEIIAIGNVAQESLRAVGMEVPKVRHPAHGGVRDFEKGVKKLAAVHAN